MTITYFDGAGNKRYKRRYVWAFVAFWAGFTLALILVAIL